jgi:hypothetical protein
LEEAQAQVLRLRLTLSLLLLWPGTPELFAVFSVPPAGHNGTGFSACKTLKPARLNMPEINFLRID